MNEKLPADKLQELAQLLGPDLFACVERRTQNTGETYLEAIEHISAYLQKAKDSQG